VTARLLAVSLLLALIAALTWQSCRGNSTTTPAAEGATGSIAGTVPRPRGVAGMPLGRLAAEARRAVRHGGVLGRCSGCATHWLRLLSSELIARAFPASTRGWAECVVSNESGFNPGAISTRDDYGLAQFHLGLWPLDELRSLVDPAYAARAFARISRWGKVRWPWSADRNACG
jgi:hypothetical protein